MKTSIFFRRVLPALTIISFIGQLFFYPRLPKHIPIQWSSDGQVNTYGPSWMALILAALPFAVWLLMNILPKIDPRRRSYQQHIKAYHIFMAVISLFLMAASWFSTLTAIGLSLPISSILAVLLGIIFFIIGNYMPQIRSNYTFGIKTPWTLEDPEVWRKTHRLGGVLFCLMGLAFILSGLFATPLLRSIIPFTVIASIVLTYGYSYILYRKRTTSGK